MINQSNQQNDLTGKILKCQEYKNKLWYFVKSSKKMVPITVISAPIFFKKLFVLLNINDFQKIPSINDPENTKNITFRKKIKGKFVMVDDNKSSVWYINDQLKKIKV